MRNLLSPLCVQSHQNEVEIFDENLAHISTWLYQTQIHLDEAERLPLAEREKVVKVRLSAAVGHWMTVWLAIYLSIYPFPPPSIVYR